MKIVITFEARASLLKKFIENGHFRAFFPMKFSESRQVGFHFIFPTVALDRKTSKLCFQMMFGLMSL